MTKTILVLASNPRGTTVLDLSREIRGIEEGLRRSQNRDQFKIEICVAVRPIDLRRAIMEIKPQIVHFCGHGEGNLGLCLENDNGKPQLVSTTALSDLFRICANAVECVVINSCYSEVQAQAIAKYINYVIGMNRAVKDDAAIKFAVGFYDGIGAGDSIERSFETGKLAVLLEIAPDSSSVRKLTSVELENTIKESNLTEHLIPVLYKSDNLFTPLENLLKNGRWKEADQETFALMLNIAHCEEKQYLDVENLQGFPFKDLKTIDNLWVTHSKGHFGFTVQNEIWKSQEISGTPHSGVTTFRAFGDRVGWRMKDSTWRDYNFVLFSMQAPKGHLPWGGWGELGHFKRWRIGYLLARFD